MRYNGTAHRVGSGQEMEAILLDLNCTCNNTKMTSALLSRQQSTFKNPVIQ